MRESRHDFVHHKRADPTPVRLFAGSRAQSRDVLISTMCKSGKLVVRPGDSLRDLKRSAKDTSQLRFDEIPMRQTLKDR
jgi:hypothetical protein